MRETWTNRAKTDWMADAGEGHATVDRVGWREILTYIGIVI